MYCCKTEGMFEVSEFKFIHNEEEETYEWKEIRQLPRYENDHKEMLLQLKLDDRFLMATTGNGFVLWDFAEENPIHPDEATYLALPHGVRNISTKMMQVRRLIACLKLVLA